MYNEVLCNCPNCDGQGYLQISQIVLGFGGFNLDNPQQLMRFTIEELKRLAKAVEGEYFNCSSCGFYFLRNEYKDLKQKEIFIKEVF
jgi:hypothetical protein